MSTPAIKKELEKATGVSRGDLTEQDYLQRMVRKIAALEDKEWEALSKAAQGWYNDAAQAMNKKTDIEGFGAEEEAAPPARRSTRQPVEAETPAYVAAVGDLVEVATVDGATLTGEIVEAGERSLFLICDGEEEVIRRKDVKTIKKVEAAPAEEPSSSAEPKVGDQVVATLNDGDKIAGELLEAGERSVVIGVGKDEEVIRRKDLKSLVVKASSRSSADEKPAAKEKEKPAAKEKEKPAAKEKPADAPKPATVRIREIMCQDPSISKDDVGAQLAKEGVEIKGTTLDITYSEVTRTLTLLRQFGNLKG